MKYVNRNKLRKYATPLMAILCVITLISETSMPAVAANSCPSVNYASLSNGSSAVNDAYKTWKTSYLTANGAGGALRVQRSANDNYDTVSEGIAYGMLFAAYLNDKPTFDGLWAYEQAHLDAKGFMNWRIDGGGGTSGYNSATDADEDMAVALVAAGQRWGGNYKTYAVTQINKLMQYDVEQGSYVLKPGDEWGGSAVMNPSYIAPSYYGLFQSITGDGTWSKVYTANNTVLSAIERQTGTGTTGLTADWANAIGQPANGMSYNYGYDAVRLPIRLAVSADWNCDATAISRLKNFNSFFRAKDLTTIGDGYTTYGNQYSNFHSGAFVGAVASAAITSGSSAYANDAWSELVRTSGGGYYHESIRLFALMVSSGVFVSPLTLPASSTQTPPPTTTPPPTISSNLDIWWPTDGATVRGTQPFKAMLTDRSVDSYAMYWQVDGGVLNAMANNSQDYPHKQADVDVSNWKWQPTGMYKISFVAKDASGNTIATRSSNITVK